MKLVPDTFIVPERLETPDFVIRKLCYSDTDVDYKAVMDSIGIIKQTRGGDWPTTSLTYEDDQIDLAWHQREFEYRLSFAYLVLSPDEREYIGCLYLYPPGFRSESSKDSEADVSFWVTQEAYNRGLYAALYKTLDSWLRSAWPFKKVIYTNKVLPQ